MTFPVLIVSWKCGCNVTFHWFLKYSILKLNDILDAVLSTDLGEKCSCLWFLWCEDLACDWVQHDKHSRHILGVHANTLYNYRCNYARCDTPAVVNLVHMQTGQFHTHDSQFWTTAFPLWVTIK